MSASERMPLVSLRVDTMRYEVVQALTSHQAAVAEEVQLALDVVCSETAVREAVAEAVRREARSAILEAARRAVSSERIIERIRSRVEEEILDALEGAAS